MFCIVSPYYNFYNNKFQHSTYYSLFLSILYRRRLGLTARPQLNSACFLSLKKDVHNLIRLQPRDLEERTALRSLRSTMFRWAHLHFFHIQLWRCGVSWALWHRGYLGTKSSMYYVEIYCYKNCSTVKLYKTQKMAANQVNFMKLFWFSTLNFSNF